MSLRGWISAGRLADLREDEGVRVQLPGGGKKDAVALFKHDGRLFALEDRCCHADKSLHGGDIEDLGSCVVGKHGEVGAGGLCVLCPRHQRKFAGGLYFNLETGTACTPAYTSKFGRLQKHRVRVHEVRVESGLVYVSAKPRRFSKAAAKQAVESVESSSSSSSDVDEPAPPPDRAASGGGGDGAPLQQAKRRREDAASRSWRCRLERVQRVSHDAFVFWLRHPVGEQLPAAPASPVWHVTLRAAIGGSEVDRDYTPVSAWSDWRDGGSLRLLIKIYPDGLMTQHLARLRLGDEVSVSSPTATVLVPSLLPPGPAAASAEPPRHVVLFAAGTGIVPMVQLVNATLQGGQRPGTVTLLYGSKTPSDLLCWEELAAAEAGRAADGSATEFRIWLAFSGAATGPPPPEPCGGALVGVVHRRLARADVAEALAHLPPREPARVICSGPDGFFEGMREAFRAARGSEAASFVNLDE